ncbi:hypothetical protein PM082_009265 [Marasmius tenuissimus]|nr:hypothetical protein PM082_009265 [Marasmius tenuissimus]
MQLRAESRHAINSIPLTSKHPFAYTSLLNDTGLNLRTSKASRRTHGASETVERNGEAVRGNRVEEKGLALKKRTTEMAVIQLIPKNSLTLV